MGPLIAGETDSVDFHWANQATGCRYLVGVHDKKTGKTTIRPTPLHILTRDVKALKGQEPIAVSVLQRLEARAALGESFGTKKAKLAIKAQEQNKVDVSAMESVQDSSVRRLYDAVPAIGHPKQSWKSFSAREVNLYAVRCCRRSVVSIHGECKDVFQKETLLLTHMFALCLRVDDYATNAEIIAKDLSQSTQSQWITKLTVADLKRLGLPDSAAKTKHALLRVPLEFPQPRGKRRHG
ncbi:A49-like RNA polymerase I associated factor-domain-containing protein [Pisolithus tinctorius]|uniref:Uncharacterized protein n=1 Tax=Pisolithus tinctorius Marx 270 TaxID=870435 RepID=A0A0C3NXJ8_PISTI|nr:A49-like RNA polymerase I associated factor-domain-containing protein [Pisolithus tinctorius]KIO00051.1 hypothetical protein M404DRAFT_29881 [Pisolithus tinctorius Marx 270]